MSFGRDTEPGEIDLSCPINWDHPDNAGLALCLSAVDGTAGGTKFLDLLRLGDRTAGGTLTNGPTWVGTPWGQWGLRFAGVGTCTTSRTINYGANGFSFTTGIRPGNTSSDMIPVGSDRGAVPVQYLRCFSGSWFVKINSNNGISGVSYVAGRLYQTGVSYDAATGATAIYIDGKPVYSTTLETGVSTAFNWRLGDFGGGGLPFTGDVVGSKFYAGPRDAGFFARDYQWSRDPATDPRLNRVTGRTYYLPLSATPSVFAPAFGPGWGFAA